MCLYSLIKVGLTAKPVNYDTRFPTFFYTYHVMIHLNIGKFNL